VASIDAAGRVRVYSRPLESILGYRRDEAIGAEAARIFRPAGVERNPMRLARGETPWLAGAILSGGVLGPVLLMLGLAGMPASGASLLLNAEGVFTALLAWFVFKENVDRRIALGMAAIVAGALVLSRNEDAGFAGLAPTLAVLGACLAWGVDNNLTRKLSLTDATWIAAIKGLVAGTVNYWRNREEQIKTI